jgi:hypothetical protein
MLQASAAITPSANDSSLRLASQVNTFFETSQEVVVTRCRSLVCDMTCVLFQVGGMFTVTLRVLSAVVAAVVTLSTWLNW